MRGSRAYAGQRRGGGPARTEFQAKTHGGDFSLFPPRDEAVRVTSQLEVRGPSFHPSSPASQMVSPTPGEVGKMGRAGGWRICTSGSMSFQLCRGVCVGAPWEPPGVLAGMGSREGAGGLGSKPGKSLELLSPDATAFSSPGLD